MDKKDILTVVVIAAVVGFLSASLGAQVGMSPRGDPTGVSYENVATSCDGDNRCEMENAMVGSLEVLGDITLGNLTITRIDAETSTLTGANLIQGNMVKATSFVQSNYLKFGPEEYQGQLYWNQIRLWDGIPGQGGKLWKCSPNELGEFLCN